MLPVSTAQFQFHGYGTQTQSSENSSIYKHKENVIVVWTEFVIQMHLSVSHKISLLKYFSVVAESKMYNHEFSIRKNSTREKIKVTASKKDVSETLFDSMLSNRNHLFLFVLCIVNCKQNPTLFLATNCTVAPRKISNTAFPILFIAVLCMLFWYNFVI